MLRAVDDSTLPRFSRARLNGTDGFRVELRHIARRRGRDSVSGMKNLPIMQPIPDDRRDGLSRSTLANISKRGDSAAEMVRMNGHSEKAL